MTTELVPLQVEPFEANSGREAWRLFVRNRAALCGLVLFTCILLATFIGPLLYTADPFNTATSPLLPPGHPDAPLLGSDELGRDVLAGLLHGGKVTLLVGVAAAAISTTIGILVGGLAGYFGGWVNAVLVRFTEFFQVLPPLLFGMVLVTLFRPSLLTITIAIGVVSWPSTARIARAEFLRLRSQEYVRAARSIGAGDVLLMLRMILPNALPPLIVMGSLVVGIAMLFEAGLSFLGLGDPNQMSWGLMLGNNRDKILLAWWPVTFPGLAIFLSVLSVSLIGDGLNDALNPRGHER